MTELANQHIVIRPESDKPMQPGEARQLLTHIGSEWTLIDGQQIHGKFAFPDFAQALVFVNQVGALAEDMGHHPDVLLGWGKVEITLWTHDVGGLHKADFILAARIDCIQRD